MRILPEPYRKAVIHAAEVEATFLVDGSVAGIWRIAAKPQQAVVELRTFKKLAKAERDTLVEEGERLARFYAPGSRVHGARVA